MSAPKAVYYSRTGSSDKSLVLIHGNSSSSQVFTSMANALNNNYSVLLLDLPGHGRSLSVSKDEYNVSNFADIIGKLIQELSLQQITLIGHSLGGHVAIELLKKTPHAYDRLITINTSPLENAKDIGQAFSPVPQSATLFKAAVTQSELNELLRVMNVNNMKELVADSFNQTDPVFREGLFESMGRSIKIGEISTLADFNGDKYMLYSKNEALLNEDYIKQLAIKNSNIKFQIIDIEGHYPFLEEPEAFTDKIKELIG